MRKKSPNTESREVMVRVWPVVGWQKNTEHLKRLYHNIYIYMYILFSSDCILPNPASYSMLDANNMLMNVSKETEGKYVSIQTSKPVNNIHCIYILLYIFWFFLNKLCYVCAGIDVITIFESGHANMLTTSQYIS